MPPTEIYDCRFKIGQIVQSDFDAILQVTDTFAEHYEFKVLYWPKDEIFYDHNNVQRLETSQLGGPETQF